MAQTLYWFFPRAYRLAPMPTKLLYNGVPETVFPGGEAKLTSQFHLESMGKLQNSYPNQCARFAAQLISAKPSQII
jgi:hypothetical protein